MEARKLRVAAIATLCVLLLVLPGQVAAKSKFCECYEDCYRQCRHHILRFACVPFCSNKCSPNEAAAAAATVAVLAGTYVEILDRALPMHFV